MIKLDLRKELKHLYSPSAKKVEIVDVPRFQFVMIDGLIEPGLGPGSSPGFQEAMGALYGAAYTLKFMSKLRKEDPIDFTVMALEGLWWVEGGEFSFERKDNWGYTVMILQPDHITSEMFAEALGQLRKKRGDQPAFSRLRLEAFHEGLCIQTMHVGPYAEERPTIEALHAAIAAAGLRPHGRHHELYVGDPSRAAPAKLRTLVRQPVEPA